MDSLVRCPECGNTGRFGGVLTVRVSVALEGEEYVCRWNEGIDFEAHCTECGADLDGDAANALYEEMRIDF